MSTEPLFNFVNLLVQVNLRVPDMLSEWYLLSKRCAFALINYLGITNIDHPTYQP